MRTPADHEVPFLQQQGCALVLLSRIESHRAAARVVAASRYRRLDLDGAIEFLRQRRDIQRVQVLHDAAVDFRFGHDVERAAESDR